VPNQSIHVVLESDQSIHVVLESDAAPIMLNREIDPGYWDYSIQEVAREAQLTFICFFDWDQLAYRDNRYVRVRVDSWPSRGGHGQACTYRVALCSVR
jgi:hypothetical protein